MSAPTASGAKPYLAIREGMRRGVHRPGDLLTEELLGDALGVSRTPIREALLRLEQDGLLVRTSRGMRVPERTVEEIVDIYEAIIILEPQATALAAHRHRPNDLLRLRDLLNASEKAIDAGTDPHELFDAWHASLWSAAANPVLVDTLDRLSTLLASRPARAGSPEDWRASHAHHTELTDLVAAHDADGARHEMERHMVAARTAALRALTIPSA
ncbi:MAG: GntR family transcriptional regulator [Microbacterium sp.]